MDQIENLPARLNQPLVVWIAGAIAAAFILLIIFDVVRRSRLRARRRGRSNRPPQPGFLKQTVASFQELRRELRRRNDRKERRRGGPE
jgi:hypothetical protein